MHRTPPLLRTAPLRRLLALALGSAPALSHAAPPDIAALLECRLGHADFVAYFPVLQDPLKAVALGWRPLPQANPFMLEYEMNSPVTVFGHTTRHIAFAGDGVVAVLDLADPRVLARELQLETGVDTPEKAIFGREARAGDAAGPDGQPGWIESAVITVSNVDSHPGKTLAGCSYSLDPPGSDGPAAPAPAVEAPSPGGAHPR